MQRDEIEMLKRKAAISRAGVYCTVGPQKCWINT
jgi:hypothetical protein